MPTLGSIQYLGLSIKEKRGFTLIRLLAKARSCQGFTLIELLVVVSILAILATISVTFFTTAQKNARDSKRLADLTAIAKSFESSKNFFNGVYSNNLTSEFTNGIPADPGNNNAYCYQTSLTTGSIPTPASVQFNTDCSGFSGSTKLDSPMPDGTKSWVVCAVKENPAGVICKNSLGM